MTYKNNSKFKVLVPLHNFNWNGKRFQIANCCSIEKLNALPDLSWCEAFLSDEDKCQLRDASHWISFEQSPTDKISPSEKVNIVLLAFWIIHPTRVQACYRFEFPHKSGSGESSSSVRILDRFQWIEQQAGNGFDTKHLERAQALINSLESVYVDRKRLWNSLVLTFNGCSTIHWQIAFICFCAAVEGILTYSKDYGITKRLAKSFACLTETTGKQRDSAFRKFVNLYNIRSDIMHGRIAGSSKRDDDKFKDLSKLSDLLRSLWETILSSPTIKAELEKEDAYRDTFFSRIESDYTPPKV